MVRQAPLGRPAPLGSAIPASCPRLVPPVACAGFSSLFLYRRWYRCVVGLKDFFSQAEGIERVQGVDRERFMAHYDCQKPVSTASQLAGSRGSGACVACVPSA